MAGAILGVLVALAFLKLDSTGCAVTGCAVRAPGEGSTRPSCSRSALNRFRPLRVRPLRVRLVMASHRLANDPFEGGQLAGDGLYVDCGRSPRQFIPDRGRYEVPIAFSCSSRSRGYRIARPTPTLRAVRRSSGGIVIISTVFGGGANPTRNTVVDNSVHANKASDIFWDGTGFGNKVRDNSCATVIPANRGWCHVDQRR